MTTVGERMERHQVVLYVGALAVGAVVGVLWPAIAEPAGSLITPVLALLLYATFLGVPFDRLGRAFGDWRFLGTVLVVNFVVVPIVVFPLSRIVAHDQALLVGVLFVLLTPCVDYVVVFTGLAGGARDRLLAATPLLMLGQIVLLPVYLWIMAGPDVVQALDLGPFVDAFVWVIVLPLLAAALTRLFARTRVGRSVQTAASSAMVPLMMLTLAIVVASQLASIGGLVQALLPAVPVFALFAAVMFGLGAVAGRVARLDGPAQRAVVFSGVTRNSLVVLPLVLALPPAFDLAALVVVTQTLVELIVMVVFVRLVPRFVAAGVPAAIRR